MSEARLKVTIYAVMLAVAAWFVLLTGLSSDTQMKARYAYTVSTTMTEGEYATTVGRRIEPECDPADEVTRLRGIFQRAR